MKRRERGVALITAVLIVALATILAVNVATKGYMDQRRSMTMFGLDQAFEVGIGGEQFAADALMRSYNNNKIQTDLSQIWATPVPAMPVDERGSFEGYLEDMQGRFNLNLLSDPDPLKRARYIKQFQRLLILVGLEVEWADKIVDWIDTDTVPLPNGAEENVYSAQTPPYHAANMNITRTSEILALADFGIDRYRKLEPFISALPVIPATGINICTAPAIVLDSFSYEQPQTNFSSNPQFLPQQRSSAGGCFPNPQTFARTYLSGPDEITHFNEAQAKTSSYFRATIWVTIGTTEFTLYSLLHRDATGVRVVTRSFGTT
jgi:general secretion pathway protein K